MTKYILHLDADSFFASVESAKNPALFGKPVITGSERGIATSMSYEAKALGITRGMPVYMIRKDFPQAIVVSSDYEAYALYSRRMFAVVRRYTDLVEEYSIDECFADITDYDRINNMSHEQILRSIQDDIQRELNISVSIGCGPTKVLAKVGSKWNKPHGIAMITHDNVHEFLSQLPIGNVWGIGASSTNTLIKKGITTAEDFANLTEDRLLSFAHNPLIDLWNELNCRQKYLLNFEPGEHPQSISRTLSFYPFKTDKEELFAELSRNVENACIKARNHDLRAKTVTWFLKTKETQFETYQIKLQEPSSLPNIILEKIRIQFDTLDLRGKIYKTTGVTLSDLIDEGYVQNDLFDLHVVNDEKAEIFKTIDILNQKHGRHIVHLASSMKGILRQRSEYAGRSQMNFFDRIKKSGKELYIPYLGETR
jgi:nucleotidyltransferase/DNA polymerase involved in DNA repair